MKKFLFLFAFLSFAGTLLAQSDDWYIQVGVFEEKVDINYFNRIGSEIHYTEDSYGFHRYYKGVYTNEEEAKQYLTKFKQLGYKAYLRSKSEFDNPCVCGRIPMPESLLNTIQNIFFDFDRSDLRNDSRRQLNDLAAIMRDFSDYKVVFRAHTDAKGSNDYNDALSMRRANSAKQFLMSKGISNSRIETETFGEESPIAKNELEDGQDTEEGRQFNRRVEIIILDKDGTIMNEIVEEIDIPDDLEIK
jgi:outer membrane protein OmpA-like peptidoglycan-associated protein